MRFFPLLDFQHWVLAVFLGLTAVILVYLAFGTYARHRPEGERGLEGSQTEGDAGGVHGGEENPVPAFLKVVYAGIVAAALGYMIFIGIRGGAF
ncbi:MAG TPA: hypothetical protein DCZ69_18885 [Syntrophobacteraceae bacterium]|nr:hypothetical protein [Syntrophobacteraceae bacterium]